MLPIRAHKPHVPVAVPRQMVGNNSVVYVMTTVKPDDAVPFAINDITVTAIADDDSLVSVVNVIIKHNVAHKIAVVKL